MDEVVGMSVVMKGRCVQFRRAEHLKVATDPVHRQDLWCSRGDATPGSHRSSGLDDSGCESDVKTARGVPTGPAH